MGIRLAKLPPELPDRTLREALSTYGEVKEVHEDSCSNAIVTLFKTGYALLSQILKSSFFADENCRYKSAYFVRGPTAHVLRL